MPQRCCTLPCAVVCIAVLVLLERPCTLQEQPFDIGHDLLQSPRLTYMHGYKQTSVATATPGRPSHERDLNVLIVTHPTSEFGTATVLGEALADRGHHVNIATFQHKAADTPSKLGFVSLGDFGDFTPQYRDALLAVQKKVRGPSTIHEYTLEFLLRGARLMASSLEEYFVAHNITFVQTPSEALHRDMQTHPVQSAPLDQPRAVDVCVFSWVLETVWEPCYRRNIPIIVQNPSVFSMPFLSSSPQLPLESIFDLQYPHRPEVGFHSNGIGHRVMSLAVWAFVWIVGPLLNLDVTAALRPNLTGQFLRMSQSIPGFDFPVDRSPMTQYTGPIFRDDAFSPDHLGNEVLRFLNTALNDDVPVVYVSFGTLVHLEESRVHKLLRAFVELSKRRLCRVLWAHEGLNDMLKAVPTNHTASSGALQHDVEVAKAVKDLILLDWVSGPAVISHAATRVLFSNCGSNAVHEALTFGAPILGMPFMTDQLAICHRVKWAGVGLTLNHFELQSAKVVDKLTQLLTAQNVYRRNALQMMSVIRRYGGVGKAADLVELAALLGSRLAELWKSPPAALGPIRGYNLDIAIFCILTAFVTGTLWGRGHCSARLVLSALHFLKWHLALFVRSMVWTRTRVSRRRFKAAVADFGSLKVI